jgi:cysteine desulfurase family protein (TIGR01976 family)
VVTHLDHDANITPWAKIADDTGAKLEWVDFDVEEGTLRMETLDRALATKPKIVAVGYASNALGTINPVKEITAKAKAAGALVFIDAVQYAPHGVIDVQDLGCDFLVSSAYKFFSTHVGVLYGRYELLDQLSAYKVRPASSQPPGKWETGTPNFEGIAGVLGAIEYIEWIANTFGEGGNTRRARIIEGLELLKAYEMVLGEHLLETLETVPGIQIYGLTDIDRLEERVPTVSFTIKGKSPADIAAYLSENGVYVWNGNYYALSVTERLGVEDSGGMVRVGPVHYNTTEEIDRFVELLRSM